jgi:hypothetical protein
MNMRSLEEFFLVPELYREHVLYILFLIIFKIEKLKIIISYSLRS